MKLIVGDVFAEFRGSPSAYTALSDILTVKIAFYVRQGGVAKRLYRHETLIHDGCFLSGLTDHVVRSLRGKGHEVEVINRRRAEGQVVEVPLDILDGITLRDYQQKAIVKSIYRTRGIIQVPTRCGKTEIAMGIAKVLNVPTLFLIDKRIPALQSAERARQRGFDSVAVIIGGEIDVGHLTVATVPTLINYVRSSPSEAQEFLDSIGLLIFDETHHLSADTWAQVGSLCPAPYRFGLSATPYTKKRFNPKNRDDLIITGLTGELVTSIDPSVMIRQGWLSLPSVYFLSVDSGIEEAEEFSWNKVYDLYVVDNEPRNETACDIISSLYVSGYKVMVLVNRVEHGMTILESLEHVGDDSLYVTGGGNCYWWESGGIEEGTMEAEDVLSFFEEKDAGVLIATTLFDEAVDFPDLDALVLLGAGKSFRQTLQRAGRPLTVTDDKNAVAIFDFWDTDHPFLKSQARERRRIYEEAGYEVALEWEAFEERTR